MTFRVTHQDNNNYFYFGVCSGEGDQWSGSGAASSLPGARMFKVDGSLYKGDTAVVESLGELRGTEVDINMRVDMGAKTVTFSRRTVADAFGADAFTELGVLEDVPATARFFATFGGSGQYITLIPGAGRTRQHHDAPVYVSISDPDRIVYRRADEKWGVGTCAALDGDAPSALVSRSASFSPLGLEWDRSDASGAVLQFVSMTLTGATAEEVEFEVTRTQREQKAECATLKCVTLTSDVAREGASLSEAQRFAIGAYMRAERSADSDVFDSAVDYVNGAPVFTRVGVPETHLFLGAKQIWKVGGTNALRAAQKSRKQSAPGDAGILFRSGAGAYSPSDLSWEHSVVDTTGAGRHSWNASSSIMIRKSSAPEYEAALAQREVDDAQLARLVTLDAVAVQPSPTGMAGAETYKRVTADNVETWITETHGNDTVVDQDGARVTRTNSSSWGSHATKSFSSGVVRCGLEIANASSDYFAVGVIAAGAEWQGSGSMSGLAGSKYYYADGTLHSGGSTVESGLPSLKGERVAVEMQIDMEEHTIAFFRDGAQVGATMEGVPEDARMFACFGGSGQFVTIVAPSLATGPAQPTFEAVGGAEMVLYMDAQGVWVFGDRATARSRAAGGSAGTVARSSTAALCPLDLAWLAEASMPFDAPPSVRACTPEELAALSANRQ